MWSECWSPKFNVSYNRKKLIKKKLFSKTKNGNLIVFDMKFSFEIIGTLFVLGAMFLMVVFLISMVQNLTWAAMFLKNEFLMKL